MRTLLVLGLLAASAAAAPAGIDPVSAAVRAYLHEAERDAPPPPPEAYGVLAPAEGGVLGWLSARAMLWYPALDGTVNDDGGGEIDLRRDLGLDDNELTFYPQVTVNVLIFGFRVDAYWLEFEGSGTITRTFNFGGVDFTINEDVTSDVEINNYRFLSLLRFLNLDFLQLSFLTGISYYEFDATLTGSTTGTARVDEALPVPVVGLLVQAKAGRFLIEVEASGFSFDYSDYDITLFDVQVSVAVTVFKIVEARVGYRYVSVDGDVDGFLADVTLDGFFVGVGVDF